MNFKDFRRKHKFEGVYNGVTVISNKILNFYTYNNRWYINILYFVLFGAVCLNIMNGDSNVLEFNTFILGLLELAYTIFKYMVIFSVLIYLSGQIIRFIIFLIKKMAT
jgi:hypothetical protein